MKIYDQYLNVTIYKNFSLNDLKNMIDSYLEQKLNC